MFDDLDTAENETEGELNSSEQDDEPIRGLSRWSHVVAGVVFCPLYFPFWEHPCGLYVAVAGSYSVVAFAIALGLALENLDDIVGDSPVSCDIAWTAHSRSGTDHPGNLFLASP